MNIECLFKQAAIENRTRTVKPKSKGDLYVWMDNEVELLLHVTLKYKVNKCQENIDWESCQSKYNDVFEAFYEQYPDVTLHINNNCQAQVKEMTQNLRFSCPHKYRQN